MTNPTQAEILELLTQKRRDRNILLQKSVLSSPDMIRADQNGAFLMAATRSIMIKPESQWAIREIISDYESTKKINNAVKLPAEILVATGTAFLFASMPVAGGGVVSTVLSAGAKAGVTTLINEGKSALYDTLDSHAENILKDRLKVYMDKGGNPQALYDPDVIKAADRHLGLDELADGLNVNVPNGAKPILNEIMIGQLTKAVTGGYLENLITDARQDADIAKLASEAVAIKHSIDKNFKDAIESINVIEKSISKINQTVDEVRQRVDDNTKTLEEHDRDIRFLADFTYGKMTASEKLEAIKANVIRLPQDQKEKEIKKQEVLKTQESLNKEINELVSHGQDTVNILNNVLGPDNKLANDLGKVVEIGSIAATAYLQYSSGNVLGAVSTVSNLFSKGKPDAAAQRHAQIMAALGKIMDKLGEMDEKLNDLLEGQRHLMQGQQLILESLNNITNKLSEMQYKITDEILFNRKLIAQFFINDLNRIKALYHNEDIQLINVLEGNIPGYDVLCGILGAIKPDSREWNLFKDLFESTGRDSINPFLLSRTHIDHAGAADVENGFEVGVLQTAVNKFDSLFSLFSSVVGQNLENTLSLALNPVPTCRDIQHRIDIVTGDLLKNPFSEKLSVLARDLINIRYLNECVDALCNTHFLYPIVCARKEDNLLQVHEFLALDKWQIDSPIDWLFVAKKVTNIAILQQSVLMGDAFLPSLYPLLGGDLVQVTEGTDTAKLFKVMADSESIFGFNLMLYAVTRRLHELNGYDSISSYKYAYDQADASELHITLSTRPKGLFGVGSDKPQWDIVRKDGAQGWYINLGAAMVRLPNTEEIQHQCFTVPSVLVVLHQLRDQISTQQATYDIPKKLTSPGKEKVWDAMIGCLYAENLGIADAPLFLP